jgi:hypothetical protein
MAAPDPALVPGRCLLTTGFRTPHFDFGLLPNVLEAGINDVYQTLDMIDAPLLANGGLRLAELVELANLSSIVGNVLANGIVKNCEGAYTRAGAHKYQDLRSGCAGVENIEIKVALEGNKPKGHLAKAGHYLTCRYVLGQEDGSYTCGDRGNVVWIWEVRLGHLEKDDFSESNTAGDSGKTAVVTTDALRDKLKLVYFDPRFCPYKSGPDWYLENYGGGAAPGSLFS